MKTILEIKHLSAGYGSFTALQDISFTLKSGDFLGLAGPNGGGKTTLAKAILGLLPSYSGKIYLFGQELGKFSDCQKIGYLPQKQSSINPLFPASVKETVALGLLSKKKWPKRISSQDKDRVMSFLELLEISNLRDKLVSDLSGGQQQRVFLARALVSDPDMLILDEPSTALDPASRENFFKLLKSINSKKRTAIILITHDTGYIGKYAQKLLHIDRKIVFFGKIGDFCPSGEVASFFEKSDSHVIWHQHN